MNATLAGPTQSVLQADMAPPARAPPQPKVQPRIGNQALLRRLQARLTIGAVDDPLEHEADAVAEQVMRAPDPASGPVETRLSRKCDTCEAEEKVQAKPAAHHHDSDDEAPAAVDEALRQPGRPLDEPTRAMFEAKLDTDLSGVRVHTGLAADKSARSVNAVGYTVGQDVVFADGRYAPGSHDGQRLLAHELAHVVQQGGGEKPKVRRQDDPAAQDTVAAGPPTSQKARGAPADLEYPSEGAPEGAGATAAGASVQRQPDATLRRQGQQGGGGGAQVLTAQSLTWADFPVSKDKKDGFSALTGVAFGWNNDGTGFTATFSKARSWSYVPDQTPYLLRHEQYHLNLAVLIANKANALAAAGGPPKGAALIKAFQKATSFHDKAYDHDTDNSQNTQMQAKWEKDIDSGAIAFPVP
jgi:hypothetical protein